MEEKKDKGQVRIWSFILPGEVTRLSDSNFFKLLLCDQLNHLVLLRLQQPGAKFSGLPDRLV
ncbi:MAG: hypothetical protein HQK58_02240 [Deltaproteobacteria bacterium]|nr:hypothetical protein [Deltaproteobacteria bacterium]